MWLPLFLGLMVLAPPFPFGAPGADPPSPAMFPGAVFTLPWAFQRGPGPDPARTGPGAFFLEVSGGQPRLLTSGSNPDSVLLHRGVRDEQVVFERIRRAHLPWTWEGGSRCDERIGRMCWNHDAEDRDWIPLPEPEAVVERRNAFLSLLQEVAALIPGDLWVAEQRVRYLAEQERWEVAEGVARECIRARDEEGPPVPGDPRRDRLAGRCHDLLGYVLHRAGRFDEAEEVFRRALDRIDPARAEARLDPRIAADLAAARFLDPSGLPPDSIAARRDFFWRLADPLWLVPGNDRWTEHQARYAAAQIREESRNPHSIPWGSDLTTILVRYGESIGWVRVRDRMGSFGEVPVVGHGPNGARSFLPPGEILEDPVAVEPRQWELHHSRPRSIHAPAYGSRIGEMAAQVSRFLRPEGALLVAGFGRPSEPPLPPPFGPGAQAAAEASSGTPGEGGGSEGDPGDRLREVEAGLFVMDPATGRLRETRTQGVDRGGLALPVPVGDHMIGVELLDPGQRRGWRSRHGLSVPPFLPDLAGLSDLLLLDPGYGEVTDPAGSLSWVLPGSRVPAGTAVGVLWETYGATPGESVTFEATLSPGERGLLRRAGEWLRVLDREPVTTVRWEETAFEAPAPLVRTVRLELDELPPGVYRLRIRARLEGRSEVESTRLLEIVPAGDPAPAGPGPR
jgi:hypothetical protein